MLCKVPEKSSRSTSAQHVACMSQDMLFCDCELVDWLFLVHQSSAATIMYSLKICVQTQSLTAGLFLGGRIEKVVACCELVISLYQVGTGKTTVIT